MGFAAESACVVVLLTIGFGQAIKLEQKYQWKNLEFAWPSESAKEEAITSGRYVAYNNLPLGLDVWNDKMFITVPR